MLFSELAVGQKFRVVGTEEVLEKKVERGATCCSGPSNTTNGQYIDSNAEVELINE
jgi:hypothetical protein